MRCFYATFTGHWPVGACAVIMAETRERAITLLRGALEEEHLVGRDDGANWMERAAVDLREMDTSTEAALVVLNGSY